MLLAPDGAATVGGDDLGGEDAGEAARGGGTGPVAECDGDEGVVVATGGDLLQEDEDIGERIVVVGDGIMVTAIEGPDLRPAAVGELGGEDIAEAAGEGGARG